jgi:hypothetical protein
MTRKINACVECKSEYYANTSKMTKLCPECAHQLYEHPRCFHKFENGRCTKCYWNGKTSEYILALKKRIIKKQKRAEIDVTLGIVTICLGAIFLFFSFLGLFGLIVGILFLIEAKKHKKQLEEEAYT